MTRDDLLEALQSNNVQAFLRLIRQGESSQDDSAYSIMFGGSHFEGFADHPRIKHPFGNTFSTAAGAYQFLAGTWDEVARQYNLSDFSPINQDCGAVALLIRRGALEDVKAGRIREAINRCAREWASLPGSNYGQPTQKLKEALEVFAAYGGQSGAAPQPVPSTATPKEVTVPIFAALLPSLLQLIPTLGSLFGSGSEVATRNVAAATAVTKALTDATQSVNLQEAVEKMQNDPAALQAAKDAMHELLPQLTDFGGGVDAARKFAAENENNRYGRILEVVTYAALLFLLLANAETFAAAYLKDDYSQIAAVIQADIGVGLMAFGFFLGSSLSSKRKDEVRGVQ